MIQQDWDDFKQVIPANAHPSQRKEMRRAFYAGAYAALCRMLEQGEPSVTEEQAAARLEAMITECEEFKNQVLGGKA